MIHQRALLAARLQIDDCPIPIAQTHLVSRQYRYPALSYIVAEIGDRLGSFSSTCGIGAAFLQNGMAVFEHGQERHLM